MIYFFCISYYYFYYYYYYYYYYNNNNNNNNNNNDNNNHNNNNNNDDNNNSNNYNNNYNKKNNYELPFIFNRQLLFTFFLLYFNQRGLHHLLKVTMIILTFLLFVFFADKNLLFFLPLIVHIFSSVFYTLSIYILLGKRNYRRCIFEFLTITLVMIEGCSFRRWHHGQTMT